MSSNGATGAMACVRKGFHSQVYLITNFLVKNEHIFVAVAGVIGCDVERCPAAKRELQTQQLVPPWMDARRQPVV